ncbi:tRNA lysidine(34) synthetase TilS [Blastochloris sulfoviridis]|uniref:tRNA(Ile)-lysidine synthase n=1 Tax=Blastochloris sulfoviridis TaxID=50712 RepID=A0A5M6HQK4_9HYPH|nr:tRNA lysidine(34) synthetase TilS [Blastochloris sulfoviridis]KAA5598153.1 tRNA lysidine(34) synthetase TilS [Blastochloris sulfoviridis]
MPAAEAALPIDASEAARLFAPLAGLPRLVLAVSGGPDSTALLVLAAEQRRVAPRFPDLLAVTVDHRLRPEAAAEAEAVAGLAAGLGVSHSTRAWIGDKPATGLMAAARAVRYGLIADAAAAFGAFDVATAHTLDDQAETVLLRLAAGSGPAGLAAMRAVERRGAIHLHRPFLAVAKARLVATLADRQVAWSGDPSNADPRFARPRLRAAWAALAREGLTADRLARLAARQARAEAALEAATDAAEATLSGAAPGGVIRLPAAALAALPAEIGLRLLGRAIGRVGTEGPVELAKLERLQESLWHVLPAPPGGGTYRRTLAGAVISLTQGAVSIGPAPPRRARKAGVKEGAREFG